MEYLTNYLTNINIDIVTIIPYEYLGQIFKLCFMSFLIVFLPLLLFLGYTHFKDALLEKEKKIASYLPKVILLAALGLVGGIFVCLKIFLPYLSIYQLQSGVQNMRTLSSVINFLIWISTGFALLFQLPLLLQALVKTGIIKIKQLQEKRKVVLVAIMIICAVLTPPDPLSLLLMIVPTYLMFEVTLYFIQRKLKKT